MQILKGGKASLASQVSFLRNTPSRGQNTGQSGTRAPAGSREASSVSTRRSECWLDPVLANEIMAWDDFLCSSWDRGVAWFLLFVVTKLDDGRSAAVGCLTDALGRGPQGAPGLRSVPSTPGRRPQSP